MSSRTWTGYIPSGYLNSAASQSSTGSIDAETGAIISTGLVPGAMTEFSLGEAQSYSNPNSTTYPNTLYDGTYIWVQLDPAVTGGALGVGTIVFWKTSQETATTGAFQVTTTVSGNAPDYAGVVIDPNFGPLAASSGIYPWAFIQINGLASASFASAITNGSPAYGDIVGMKAAALTTWDDYEAYTATTAEPFFNILGIAKAAPAASTVSLVRIIRPPVRF